MIVLDPVDRAFEEAIIALASKVEEELPGLEENKLGLCSILTKVFYIIRSVTFEYSLTRMILFVSANILVASHGDVFSMSLRNTSMFS